MRPETVVCWLWRHPFGTYRSTFTTQTVNVLQRMVQRHFPHPHRFVCVTDITKGLDKSVEVIPAWNDFIDLPSPYGRHQPSCYRRLRMFHPDIAAAFGKRFVSIDLDTVIVDDLTPLWDRPEDFVAWGETNANSFYNGSMLLMTAGSRPQVWERFSPKTTPTDAKLAGKFGSDQGAISWILGKGEAIWTTKDGVYSYNVHLRHAHRTTLPDNARIVMFHGALDPWQPDAQRFEWVRRHYQ